MPTITDPDADEKYAPKVDTQHGTTDMSESEREFDGSRTPIVGSDLRGRENKAAQQSVNSESAGRSVDPKSLDNKEQEMPPDRSGFSAADDMREKLGQGYTGKGSTKSKGLSKLYSNNSKFKKKVAIAGAAAGGSLIIGVITFLAMLPLKIEHMVSNLENTYSAAAGSAVDRETENLFSAYITKQVLPNLHTKACHSTANANCVSVADNTTPVGKLFNSWKQGRLEQKLATKYGIVIESSGNTFRLNTNGHSYTIKDGKSIFDLEGTSTKTRNEIRHAVRDSLKETTLYDKVMFRFKVGKLLESKYGIKRCLIACDSRDKFADKVADKKLAGKAFLIRRVVQPFSESLSLAFQCVASGGCQTTPSDDNDTTSDNGAERQSKFSRDLQAQLDAYAEKFGSDALKDLVNNADIIGKDGLSKYMFRSMLEKVVGHDISAEALDKVMGPTGWVNFAAKVVSFVNSAGPTARKVSYAMGAAAAVQMYMTYRTVASEMQSGHVDPTELGSLTDELSNHGVDASSTPLYNNLMGGESDNTQTSFLDGVLPGAYADSASTSNYVCQNGGGVPVGKLVCPEENFTGGSELADNITNAAHNIPGWGAIVAVANAERSFVGRVIDTVFASLGDMFAHLPGISQGLNAITGFIDPLIKDFGQKLFLNPLIDGTNNGNTASSSTQESFIEHFLPKAYADTLDNSDQPVLPSGGRVFDLMAAGADVSANKSCEVQLGCAQISDQTVSEIRVSQLNDEKQDFDSQSMFARVFSTASPYSLVSRLAMDMPTNMLTATNSSFASLIGNPLSELGSVVSSIFTGNHAFAASAAQPDPFGVVQYGYTDAQIDSIDNDVQQNYGDDYSAYYQQNCTDANTKAWLDNQATDENTGESVATTTNPCLLVQSIAQTAGAAFDPSTLPAGSQNEGSE